MNAKNEILFNDENLFKLKKILNVINEEYGNEIGDIYIPITLIILTILILGITTYIIIKLYKKLFNKSNNQPKQNTKQ